MSEALYRKYRSRSLDEIVGQSHITGILKRALEQEKISHAYLLTGPAGVGKTSIARILAHEINNLPYEHASTHLDIIEIDAASNNSVEDVRELSEKVQIAPVIAKKKIYIIDEVHMLSKQAFNALLKTLEEPPEHVVFILATTDVEKLPATIVSRVQRFNFRPIHIDDAVSHLRTIADLESIAIDDEALHVIAEHGQGSFRNSISLLDQLQHISGETITRDLVENLLGLAESETINSLISDYSIGNITGVVTTITESGIAGTSAVALTNQLIATIRRRLVGEPDLLGLLDKLADVSKSSWPEIKLMSALSNDSAVRSSHPSSPVATPATIKPVKKSSSSNPSVKKSVPSTTPLTKASQPDAPTVSESEKELPFPWQEFLLHIKEKAIGAFSLLGGCQYVFDGSTLTLYAGKKFTKTKLEKNLPIMSEALHSLQFSDIAISIKESTKPPSDSKTAEVLAMMGGGEEVNL